MWCDRLQQQRVRLLPPGQAVHGAINPGGVDDDRRNLTSSRVDKLGIMPLQQAGQGAHFEQKMGIEQQYPP